ncbi:MAG: uracil phosphoribosyltransferase [Clostridia bacterium]
MSITIVNHPMIKHKVALLKDKNTTTKDFSQLVEELAILLGYEATREFATELVEIETPLEKTSCEMVSGKKVAIVPILRAGLGMVAGMLKIVPSARVGHIGLYRDETTLEPVEYYCKLPSGLAERDIILVDPMLATGGSACDAIRWIKAKGGKRIKMVSIIAAPIGLQRVSKEHPDVDVYIACQDRELNEHGYILPGLGDAGDRIFGTK